MKYFFIISFLGIFFTCEAQENKVNINNATIFCKKGELLMQQKKYDTAFLMFSEAVTLFPNAKFLCKRGACLMLQMKYNEALADFDNAIIKDGKYSEAYFLKATVFQFINKTNEAIYLYSKAITLNPNYTDAYLMRGLLYAIIKKKNQACDDLHKALKLGSIKAQLHISDVCGG